MASHDTLAAEAAAFLEVLAGRLQRFAEPGADASHDAQRCTGCPICVALTYIDEHRDVGAQLAQGMLTMVTALRQHIPAGGGNAEAGGARPAGDAGGAGGGRDGSDGAAGGATAASNGGASVAAKGAVQRIDIR